MAAGRQEELAQARAEATRLREAWSRQQQLLLQLKVSMLAVLGKAQLPRHSQLH